MKKSFKIFLWFLLFIFVSVFVLGVFINCNKTGSSGSYGNIQDNSQQNQEEQQGDNNGDEEDEEDEEDVLSYLYYKHHIDLVIADGSTTEFDFYNDSSVQFTGDSFILMLTSDPYALKGVELHAVDTNEIEYYGTYTKFENNAVYFLQNGQIRNCPFEYISTFTDTVTGVNSKPVRDLLLFPVIDSSSSYSYKTIGSLYIGAERSGRDSQGLDIFSFNGLSGITFNSTSLSQYYDYLLVEMWVVCAEDSYFSFSNNSVSVIESFSSEHVACGTEPVRVVFSVAYSPLQYVGVSCIDSSACPANCQFVPFSVIGYKV